MNEGSAGNPASRAAEFQRIVRRMLGQEDLSLAESLAHFDLQNADAQQGLPLGAAAPDFTLNDQYGRGRRRADVAGERGLLVVFNRSAHW